MHISWIRGTNEAEDELILFHVGGVDGEDRISWATPELSIGDEITIKISKDEVVDSAMCRTPYKKTDRSKSSG
jgi:hypothetical protein